MKFTVGTKEYDIDDAVITKAIEDKTTVLELAKDVIVRTNVEDNAFVENMKKEARKEGLEIAVKKSREELGLSFEGKTLEKLVDAVKAKAVEEAGLNPDEAVTKIKAKLSEKELALQTAISRADQAEKNAKDLQSSFKIDKALDQFIPSNTALPVEDIKIILKSKLEFKDNEGNLEVYSGGQLLKNATTMDALPAKDAIENFFRDNTHYMKAAEGGNGGGDSGNGGNGGKLTIEKFNENMKTKGHTINSAEYTAELNKAITEKLIDLD